MKAEKAHQEVALCTEKNPKTWQALMMDEDWKENKKYILTSSQKM